MKDEEIQVFGDGTIERDFIYIDDVCKAVEKAIDVGNDKIESISAVNIGSGKGSSINEILYSISTILSSKLKIRYLPSRSFDVKKNVLHVGLAGNVLSWKPATQLADGISKTLEYMKSQTLEK